MSPRILLDLSRLLSRAERPVPTGIDRVELAYARHLIAACRDRVSFAAMYWSRLGPLPAATAIRFVEALGAAWHEGGADAAARRRLLRLAGRLRWHVLAGGAAGLETALRRRGGQFVYLLVSHHHLDRPAVIRRLKQATGARFVCLVHDLIPMQFPEYARPEQAARHRLRMDTVATLADAVIVNSASTAVALQAHLAEAGGTPPVLVAPLGIDPPPPAPGLLPASHPYFVCIGTIEPKKNHVLLLTVWRRLAERDRGCPGLILIGQRGWENENVIDLIERSVPLRGIVREQNRLPDQEVRRLLAGARALLLPSFAEGYGLPIAEALALGVPVLCSDLAVFREVGRAVPEYLDPLDGPAWRQAVLDYATPESPRREAQLRRLAGWTVPSWAAHFALLHACLDGQPAA